MEPSRLRQPHLSSSIAFGIHSLCLGQIRSVPTLSSADTSFMVPPSPTSWTLHSNLGFRSTQRPLRASLQDSIAAWNLDTKLCAPSFLHKECHVDSATKFCCHLKVKLGPFYHGYSVVFSVSVQG